jgi:hypothetical protein
VKYSNIGSEHFLAKYIGKNVKGKVVPVLNYESCQKTCQFLN